MPATWGVSSYGKTIIIDEGEENLHTTPLRAAYLLADFLMYLIPTVIIGLQYLHERAMILKQRQKSAAAPLWLLTTLFVLYLVNNAIRSAHLVDHNYRPVYYHEPPWAYQKVLIVEMELATYGNILISVNGFFAFRHLLASVYENKIAEYRTTIMINGFLYFVGAFFTLVHYTLEPPSNYGAFANFTIAGPTITGIPLLALVLYALFVWGKNAGGTGSTKSSRGKGKAGAKAKESKKLLADDNEDTQTRTEDVRVTRSRRRSKTPVKSSKPKK